MFMGLYNYWIVVVLMMIGLYIVIAHGNLIKKMVGLTIFQTSVFIFYISMAKADGGTAPILADGISQYSNPLPHVLILTAIVVGIATTALGLALAVRIKEAYGSIEESDIQSIDNQASDIKNPDIQGPNIQNISNQKELD
jgi:multicomponent Na+:H+ antiporter subunit C